MVVFNWIHPFVEGNGRTARAVCYYLICVRNGAFLKGRKIVPERIREDRRPYYKALKDCDIAWEAGRLDLSSMEDYIAGIMQAQLDTPASPPNSAWDPLSLTFRIPTKTRPPADLPSRKLAVIGFPPFAYAGPFRRVSLRSDHDPRHLSRRREPRLRARRFRPRHRQIDFSLARQAHRRDGRATARSTDLADPIDGGRRASSSSPATIRARSNSSATTRRMCSPRRCSRCGPTRR